MSKLQNKFCFNVFWSLLIIYLIQFHITSLVTFIWSNGLMKRQYIKAEMLIEILLMQWCRYSGYIYSLSVTPYSLPITKLGLRLWNTIIKIVKMLRPVCLSETVQPARSEWVGEIGKPANQQWSWWFWSWW